MNEKIMEKLEDPKFTSELMKLEDESKVKELFAKEGIDITEKEKGEIAQAINKVIDHLRKIPEDELKSIAGGVDEKNPSEFWEYVKGIKGETVLSWFNMGSSYLTNRRSQNIAKEVAQMKADASIKRASFVAGSIAVSAISLGLIGAYSLKKWYSKNKSKAQ